MGFPIKGNKLRFSFSEMASDDVVLFAEGNAGDVSRILSVWPIIAGNLRSI